MATQPRAYIPAAERVRAVLARAGVPTDAYMPVCAPHVVTLAYRVLAPDAAPTPPRMAAILPQIETALGVPNIRARCSGGIIRVEVAQRSRRPVLLDRVRAEYPRVGLGISASGRALSISLDNPGTAHALIVGQTGSGKSELLRAMVCQVAGRDDVTLALIDADARTWAELSGYAHIAETPADAAALLEWARAQMDIRARGQDGPRVVLAIDEAQTIAGTAAARTLADIIARGRKHGVHVWAATQYPRADVLDSRIASQFGVRVCGRVHDAQTSARALGIPGAYAERLTGAGDMIAVFGGTAQRVQAPLCAAADWPEPCATGDAGTQSFEIIEHLRAQPGDAAPPVRNAAPNARRDADADALRWIMASAVRTPDGWHVPGVNQIAARYGIGNTAAARWQAAALSQLSQASQDGRTRVLAFAPRLGA